MKQIIGLVMVYIISFWVIPIFITYDRRKIQWKEALTLSAIMHSVVAGALIFIMFFAWCFS